MGRYLKLTPALSPATSNNIEGQRLRVVASDPVDMPTKVFRYLMRPLNPQTGERVAMFDGVCSPADIEEMPEDEPTTGSSPPWFRLDYVDLVVRSTAEATELLDAIAGDVRTLKSTYDLMDQMTEQPAIHIGFPPDSSSSMSV